MNPNANTLLINAYENYADVITFEIDVESVELAQRSTIGALLKTTFEMLDGWYQSLDDGDLADEVDALASCASQVIDEYDAAADADYIDGVDSLVLYQAVIIAIAWKECDAAASVIATTQQEFVGGLAEVAVAPYVESYDGDVRELADALRVYTA